MGEVRQFPRVPRGAGKQPKGENWPDLLRLTTKEAVRATVDNAALILGNHAAWVDSVRYDEFRNVIVATLPPVGSDETHEDFVPREWTDADDTRTAIWLSREYDASFTSKVVGEAINVVARANGFHPVRLYVEGLEWDGKARLDTWLSTYAGVERTPYSEAVGAMFWVSMVARIFEPGCQADYVLVLEGAQGCGKSQLVRNIPPDPDWTTDRLEDLGSKDAALQLQGVVVAEIAELSALNHTEMNKAKFFISCPNDKIRVPYGRRRESLPRQCVFIGTTNCDTYLRDATGGRRFWPVRVGSIHVDRLVADRDQLWAEAHAQYLDGRPWWPDASQMGMLCSEQEDRYSTDPWESEIERWLTTKITTEPITTELVLRVAIAKDAAQWTRADQMRVADVMKRLGYEQQRRSVNGNRSRYWELPNP